MRLERSKNVTEIVARMRELIGKEYGAIKRYAETIGEPRSRLMNYLTDQRVPPIRVLEKMAEKDGVDLHWLITGKGPKYVEKEGFKTFRRVPILGKVPAGPSGGEHWSEYDAKDLLTVAVPADDPDVIALQVQGESMYPTLYDGDHVLMSPNSTWNEGDVIVAEVSDSPEEFVIKRLGRSDDDDDGVMLVSDNFLRYPPRIYGKREVAIRGRVLRVIRTPSRREARFLGNVEFAEVHRSEYIQQAMMFLPKLSEREQRAVAEHIRVLAERD